MAYQFLTKIFILGLLALAGMGCGKKAPKTNLKFNLLAINGTSSAEGIVILGKNNTTGERFQEIVFQTSIERALGNGDWTFFGFTWNGGAPMLGDIFCTPIIRTSLQHTDTEVRLSMNSANCFAQGVFQPGGIDTLSSPNVPYNLSFRLCPPDVTASAMASGFCSYTGMATGMRFKLPIINFLGVHPGLESACKKVTSGNASTSIKFPHLNGFVAAPGLGVEVYYSPLGASCVGANCCQGREEHYRLKEGLAGGVVEGDPSLLYSSYSNTLLLAERPPKKTLKFDSTLTSFTYNICTPVSVNLLDEFGAPSLADIGFVYHPNCGAGSACQFFSDQGCTTASNGMTFPAGNTAHTFYMKVSSPLKVSLFQSGDDVAIGGDSLLYIPVNVPYADITATMLNSLSSVGLIGSASPTSALLTAGSYVAYETVSGNRGKFFVNARSTAIVTDDVLNFNFITWDGTGNVVAQGTGITSTACFSSGDCFLDFDIPAGKISPSNVPGNTDVWWQTSGGGQAFSPQAMKPFRMMSP